MDISSLLSSSVPSYFVIGPLIVIIITLVVLAARKASPANPTTPVAPTTLAPLAPATPISPTTQQSPISTPPTTQPEMQAQPSVVQNATPTQPTVPSPVAILAPTPEPLSVPTPQPYVPVSSIPSVVPELTPIPESVPAPTSAFTPVPESVAEQMPTLSTAEPLPMMSMEAISPEQVAQEMSHSSQVSAPADQPVMQFEPGTPDTDLKPEEVAEVVQPTSEVSSMTQTQPEPLQSTPPVLSTSGEIPPVSSWKPHEPVVAIPSDPTHTEAQMQQDAMKATV